MFFCVIPRNCFYIVIVVVGVVVAADIVDFDAIFVAAAAVVAVFVATATVVVYFDQRQRIG